MQFFEVFGERVLVLVFLLLELVRAIFLVIVRISRILALLLSFLFVDFSQVEIIQT